jgi:lipid-binding SYLF domain-containing protein
MPDKTFTTLNIEELKDLHSVTNRLLPVIGLRLLKSLGAVSGLLLMLGMPAFCQSAEISPDKRLQSATLSFREVMNAPDKTIPRDLYDKARCIVIIPGMKKAAFIFGGKYGKGFVSCRQSGSGRFGSPAAVGIEGGSYGLQIGGSSTDVFMLIMNEGGMRKLLTDKFTLGGEAAAAAGPVGRDTSANTDVLMHAEILSWSRSRGLFAGLSLEGATLHADAKENSKLYGKELTNQDILQRDVAPPRGARPLVAELNHLPATNAKTDASSLAKTGRVILSDLHFATGSAQLTPDSGNSLTSAAAALKDNPDWRVRVEGYTDNVGSQEANLKLSNDRANAVMDWLGDHGIERNRLSAQGFGESHAIAKTTIETGRAKNRRVELVRM